MSNHHLSRRDVERIVGAPAESDHPVGPALEALRAPGSTSELLREDATVAAFRAARLAPAAVSRTSRSPVTPRSAAARAVAATGLVVALGSGGFALAASGHLPTLPDQASDRASEAVALRTTAPSESPTTAVAETGSGSEIEDAVETETVSDEGPELSDEVADETSEETADEGTEDASAVPTPALEGLCKAFQAHDKSLNGKALDSAAFTALAIAAGSKDAVATYCVTLVGEPKATGQPTLLPTQATQAIQSGTGRPSTQPAPTTTPTAKPSPQPDPKPTAPAGTGKPTTAPSPDDAGPPDHAGKPDDAGKPDTTGTH
jgi:hypothetical protein